MFLDCLKLNGALCEERLKVSIKTVLELEFCSFGVHADNAARCFKKGESFDDISVIRLKRGNFSMREFLCDLNYGVIFC